MQKTMSRASAGIIHTRCHVGAIWKNSMTMTTAMSEKAKLKAAEKTFCTGKTQRSTLTFLSSGAASMIERRPVLVASFMREKVMLPTMR